MRPSFAMLIAALLLALAIIGAVVAVGVILRDRPPFPPAVVSNGVIAVSANPWTFGGGENGDVYLVTKGAAPRRIIGSDGDGIAQACPQFSPDGGMLAYGEARASGPVTTARGAWPVHDRAIVVVGSSARGDISAPLMRVALAEPGRMVCPEWSPTGRYVAYRAGVELFVADVTSGSTRVFPIVSVIGQEENELEWSRDGSMIAVAEPGQIRVIHVDGAPWLIHVDGGAPRSLGWTAGDARIVYVSTVPVDEIGSAIHVVGADGTNDVSLMPPSTPPGVGLSFNEAVISPDGTLVAYLQESSRCTADGCGPGPVVEPIGITDVDGVNWIGLSIPAAVGRAQGSDVSDFFASGVRWAPDGKRLLLSSIAGVISIGVEPGSPAIVYANGKFEDGLNLEWSYSEVTWQPTVQ